MLGTPTATLTQGTLSGGAISSLTFDAQNHLFGNIVAVATGVPADATIILTDNILELTMADY